MAGFRGRARRYLSLRGRTWWLKIGVPAAIRDSLEGKTAWLESLETSDLRVAMQRRDQREREILGMFRALRAGDPVAALVAVDRGRMWREAIAADDTEEGIASDLARVEYERLAERNPVEATRFANAVHGREAVDAHLDAYLQSADITEKTRNERRGLVGRFARWARDEALTLPDVDRSVAGRWYGKELEGRPRATVKKYLTALTGYWDFMNRRGHVARFEDRDNPWRDQQAPARRNRKAVRGDRSHEPERPFSSEEMTSLLSGTPMHRGKPDDALADMIRVSALSGMRLAEVCGLQVQDVRGSGSGDQQQRWFHVEDSKTEAGRRRVPVHPELADMIDQRTEGRPGGAPLFAEVADMKNPGDTFGKRFKRHREACGVADMVDGRRRSLVNFHSFRRTFVTQMEQAGIPETTTALIVGHEEGRKNITYGRYSGGVTDEQLVDAVSKASLPRTP